MSKRYQKRKVSDERIEYILKKIDEKGHEIWYYDNTKIEFVFNGNIVTYFPNSGWATGKGIQDGHGLNNLLEQI